MYEDLDTSTKQTTVLKGAQPLQKPLKQKQLTKMFALALNKLFKDII